jgi:glycosyltransferase involved in cell wall biosynthesis
MEVLRREGLKGLIVRIMRKSSKTISVMSKTDVITFYDFICDLPRIPFSKEDCEESKLSSKTYINWIVPEIGVGSGGHINIFRFCSYLQRKGHHNRVYVFKSSIYKSNKVLTKFVHKHFNVEKSIEFICDIGEIKYADATIATSWQTAYYVNIFDNTRKKFYFVQDFEPFFYAVGSEYAFAENTYKMNLIGLTAGEWLKNKLSRDYGMRCTSFSFSYDKEIYKPIRKRDKTMRVLFYARPVTPRRMFEIGLIALNKFYQKFPDAGIIFAGWDVGGYAVPFPHLNAGCVDVPELSDLYSQCDVVLTLSGTNLSLLPLEVMACKTALMSNRGENVEWLLNDENSILCDLSVEDISSKLIAIFNDSKKLKRITEKGYNFSIESNWDKEGEIVEAAILEELYVNE